MQFCLVRIGLTLGVSDFRKSEGLFVVIVVLKGELCKDLSF